MNAQSPTSLEMSKGEKDSATPAQGNVPSSGPPLDPSLSEPTTYSHATACVVQRTLERIAMYDGVIGYLVLNYRTGVVLRQCGFHQDDEEEGDASDSKSPSKSGRDDPTYRRTTSGKKGTMSQRYARSLFSLTQLARSTLRTMDGENDLTFLRMRWDHRDILIAPDPIQHEYMIVVVQDVTVARSAPQEASQDVESSSVLGNSYQIGQQRTSAEERRGTQTGTTGVLKEDEEVFGKEEDLGDSKVIEKSVETKGSPRAHDLPAE